MGNLGRVIVVLSLLGTLSAFVHRPVGHRTDYSDRQLNNDYSSDDDNSEIDRIQKHLSKYTNFLYTLATNRTNLAAHNLDKTLSKLGKFSNRILNKLIPDHDYNNETNRFTKKTEASSVPKLNYSAIMYEIENDLSDWHRSGKSMKTAESRSWILPKLPHFLQNALGYLDIKQVLNEIQTSLMGTVSCTACKSGIGLLDHYIKSGKTNAEIGQAAIKLCNNLQIETPRVCKGIIHLMKDQVIYIVANLVLAPEEICGVMIGDGCGSPYNPWADWHVTFPPIPKPAVPNYKIAADPKQVMKVLHVSDTHFDPYYVVGSNADCNEPLCCRITDGPPKTKAQAAGVWGDFRKCDTPLHTIESMFQHIVQQHPDLDYIIWTGDLPPHDVWNQTIDDQLHIIRETTNQMVKYFPNTPIFPSLGNHESTPVNSFPPPGLHVDPKYMVQWLYNELAVQWKRWLPEDTATTIRFGGFYSVLVKPGFRLISLNMNFCHNHNWWLALNTTDPAQELQWLIYELQAAELNGEKVHILGHIPPGHPDCLGVWSRNYNLIVNRYEATITAQFFGHTHFDEYQIFYDPQQKTRPTNIAYIGPSVTPYFDLNPGYRVYTIEGNFDGSSRQVLDHENWYLDLVKANKYGPALWQKLYNAKELYKMRSLAPVEWDYLVNKMLYNDDVFNDYYRNYWKNSPRRKKCDEQCKERLLCDVVSSVSHIRKLTCKGLQRQLEAQDRSDWHSWLWNGVVLVYVDNVLNWFGFRHTHT